MPVNTRRQTAGLSSLIKVSKKNERKQFQNGRCSIIHQAGQTQIQKIESFNATIKRDFSLRKRYSVLGSVDIIEEIILYYSTCKKEFWVTPKFDKDTKAQEKRCIIGSFKQRSNGKIMYKDKYMISLTERTCSCVSSQEFRKGFI
jgi:hypothetical protein